MRRKSTVMLAILVSAAMAVIPLPLSNVHAQETPIGTMVGNVLFTDIQAFVNGTAIRSMNIDGNTAIYVEDLRGHGFDVAWEPNKRQVSIFPDNANMTASNDRPDFGYIREAVGNKITDVLSTDIHTFALGKEITSYNVGGKTAIFLKDLSPLLGSLEWDEKLHLASFKLDTTIATDPQAKQSHVYPLQVEQTASNKFSVQFTDDAMFVGDEQIGFAQDGRAMLSIAKMARLLHYQTETRDKSLYVSTNTYAFQLSASLDTAKLYWFGGKISEDKLAFNTIERDGELYVSELDLKQLFGYSGNWDSDSRRLDIDYANYDVKDFGVSERTNNYWYTLNGLLLAPGTMEMPNLSMVAVRDGMTYGGNSSTSVMDQRAANGSPQYQFGSAVQLDLGDNTIRIAYQIGKRLVYSKTIVNSVTPTSLKPVINYNDLPVGLGEFSSITLDAPSTSLMRTDNGKVDVKGAVTKTVGNGLQAVIEKEDNGSWSNSETVTVPFDKGQFAASLSLTHGTGRYRVTLRSELHIPAPHQFNPFIDVARFYIDYRDPLSRILGMQASEGFSSRDGKLMQTSDTGHSWDVVLPDGIGDNEHLLAADFSAPLWGFAFYRSNEQQPKLVSTHPRYDGGWETATLPTIEPWETSADVNPIIANLYQDPAYVMLTSSSPTGPMLTSLYRTDDRGQSWVCIGDLNLNFSDQPTGISFRKEKEGWITTTNHNESDIPLYRSQDGGVTWSVQHVAFPADIQKGYVQSYPPSFDQESDNHAIFISEFVQDGKKTYVPYETRDDGETWNPLPFRLNNVQDVPVFHFDSLLMGRAISQDGYTIYTMDTYAHQDWQVVHSQISLQNATQFFLRSDGYGWVLLNGSVLVTNDGGRTWDEPTTN
ncbi:hypothetical protein A8709_17785 [Paenibacillus pectinilyticus]|uniref:Photosynthesis system II assembly factor Ycf48/Hcf136-like domain-containing protein n=1 Tax=Paenibacillus pectinilyticus TaxID=512399 RepID=A0A1C0ZZ91_9BACL|nr:hypothetical protein [Paenibacillus pectinilyticus]OCT13457.1 hypothetical protein A8709_17785 [Paenibacillus pectinilyticus]